MFEGICVLIIVGLIWYILNKASHQPSSGLEELKIDNDFLRQRLNEHDSLHKDREETLNQTIKNLQSSLDKQQNNVQSNSSEHKQREKDLSNKIIELEKKLDSETESRKKILSQKKSSEVRLGHIAETLAPFLDQFDFEPERCSFLGQPIDYVSFGDDEITFIEVKSGNSQLSQKQKHIKHLVEQKLISWKEIRIK
jgi:predicted Holliday junction resolvase-like endonuclease